MTPDLQRFIDAQRTAYDDAVEELRRGRKAGHWIWFVFPQLAGLGQSSMSRHYAITSLDEARAYLPTRSWARGSASVHRSSWPPPRRAGPLGPSSASWTR